MGDIYVNANPLPVDPNALSTTIPPGGSLTSDFIGQVLDAANAGNRTKSGNAPPKPTSGFIQDAIDAANARAAAKSTGSSTGTDPFANGANPFQGPAGGMSDPFANGRNPFVGPTQAPPERPLATPSSIFANLAAGANEGVADVVGAPIDLVAGAINLGIRGINAATGANIPQATAPVGGSQSIKNTFGLIGANPDAIMANQPIERIMRGVGGGAAAAVAPEAMLGGLGAAGLATLYPRTARFFGSMFGAGGGASQAAGQAAIGAAAGGTGEGAAEVVPEPLKPIARTVGNLAGGVGGAVTGEAGQALPAALRAARDYVAPMTTDAAKQALAQRMFAGGVTDRGAALDALKNEPTVGVGNVPRTAYQATGDAGVGAMERESETAEGGVGAFNARRAAQNEARVSTIRALQPEGCQ
jgi:hypothetical protein